MPFYLQSGDSSHLSRVVLRHRQAGRRKEDQINQSYRSRLEAAVWRNQPRSVLSPSTRARDGDHPEWDLGKLRMDEMVLCARNRTWRYHTLTVSGSECEV